jgi:hypothetical protein
MLVQQRTHVGVGAETNVHNNLHLSCINPVVQRYYKRCQVCYCSYIRVLRASAAAVDSVAACALYDAVTGPVTAAIVR